MCYSNNSLNIPFCVQHCDRFVLLHYIHPIQIQNRLSEFHHENINYIWYQNEKAEIQNYYINLS